MKLLLSQKNHLFDLIEKSGLTPGLFEYAEYNRGSVGQETKITLNNSPFFSINKNSANAVYLKVSPGGTKYEETCSAPTWDELAKFNHYSYIRKKVIF